MPILAKDLALMASYEYPLSNSFYRVIVYAFTALEICGMIGSLALLATSLLRTEIKPKHLIYMSLPLADLIFCIHGMFYNGVWGAKDTISWTLDSCLVNFAINISAPGISMLTMASIALEKYLSISKHYEVTWGVVIPWIFVVWLLPLSTAAIPHIRGTYMTDIMLQPDLMACLGNWSSIDVALSLGLAVSVLMASGIIITAVSYYKLYQSFKSAAKSSKRRAVNQLQKQVFTKCLVMTGVFALCWTPELLNISYTMIFGPLPAQFSAFCTGLVVLQIALNPILLYRIDTSVRVRSMFFKSIPFPIKRPISNQSSVHVHDQAKKDDHHQDAQVVSLVATHIIPQVDSHSEEN